MGKSELLDKIQNDLRAGNTITNIAGAFGDVQNCEGYIENVIKPKEGGTLTKLYGCSYLFKGYPLMAIVERIGLAKAMISAIPRRILAKSFLFQINLILMYFFARKKFFHYFYVYTSLIYYHTIIKIDLPPERYNVLTRELKRALLAAILKTAKNNKSDFDFSCITHTYDSDSMKHEFYNSLYHLSTFVCFFLEYDNAYRFRLQDVIAQLNKENVKKSVIKEVKRLLTILIQRENHEIRGELTIGIPWKWEQMKIVLIGLLLINKQIRDFVKEFLLEVDIDKVKLDENDRYFSLNRIGYNFDNISYEDRLAEKKRIDKEKGHLRVQMMDVHFANPSAKNKESKQLGLRVIQEYD